MQISNALRVAILLALYSFASADVTAGASNGSFCYWTRSVATGRSHHTFLQSSADARSSSLQLYHSVWTLDGRLVYCTVTDEPAVAESYLSLCRGEQHENFTDVPEPGFNISRLFTPDSPCAHPFPAEEHASKRAKRQINDPVLAERAGDISEVKVRRQKRAWIIPGTVWCGSGDKAAHYDDLGLFTQTDKCCREHDHCANIIPSFTYGYGIFNRHFFTVLHCDCEERFRQCLLAANDRVSYMVGYGYFNLLKTPCFTFTQKMQCAKTNWFGMCTLSKMSPYAVLQEAMEYNSTEPENEPTGGVTAVPTTPGAQKVTLETRNITRGTQNVTQGTWNVTPRTRNVTPGTRNITPGTRNITGGTQNVTQGTWNVTPRTRNATPGTRNITSGTRNITSGTWNVTPGTWNVTRGTRNVTPGTRNVAQGNRNVTQVTQNIAQGTRNMTQGTQNVTQGTQNIAQGTRNMTQGTWNVTPGTQNVTPGTRNMTQGTRNVTPGTRNMTQGTWNITQGTRNVTQGTQNIAQGTRNVTFGSVSPKRTPVQNVTSPAAGHGKPPVRRPKPLPRCALDGLARGNASKPGRRRGLRKRVCVDQPKGRDSDAQLMPGSTGAGGDPAVRPLQRGDPSSENALPAARPGNPPPVPHNQPAPMEDPQRTDTLQPCDCYKQLDECKLKIPPLSERFGLKNPERKTLYHCNCTNSLAQQLRDQEEQDAVQSLLVDFVSLSCFLLPPEEECPGTAQRCPAVLSEASHLQLALAQRGIGGEGKHPEMPILKVKRHNSRKARTKPIKLYRKCLRMMDSKTPRRVQE